MRLTFQHGVRSHVLPIFVVALALLAVASSASAQTHVVSPVELQQQLLDAGRARAANMEKLSEFLTSPQAGQAFRRAHMDPVQMRAAVSTLSDRELAQLSVRAAQAQRDFAAGELTDRDLLLILVGIAALILIIVAVR
jgi:hypothetical protein